MSTSAISLTCIQDDLILLCMFNKLHNSTPWRASILLSPLYIHNGMCHGYAYCLQQWLSVENGSIKRNLNRS
eukprot:m.116512 g.116512  ORF g.116512 m.116512 type:complete len:72 (-) comp14233_c0_seq1:3637-3852(-)